MPVNNFDIVSQFMPGQPLGPVENNDHFLYTELLDRTKRVGNNGVCIVKTFYHRSLTDFSNHWPQIQTLCDNLSVRAYTRLSPRSFERVGKVFTKLVVEAAMSNNWAGMKSLYTRACGIVTPEKKLWMFDVDIPSFQTKLFGVWLTGQELLIAKIPNKRGLHFITPAFDLCMWNPLQHPGELEIVGVPGMTLHKDNATNLYVPDGAA